MKRRHTSNPPLPTHHDRCVADIDAAKRTATMFGRRVASSCRIPANMYARLGISSSQQAMRMLPPLVPITTAVSRSVSGGTGVFASLIAGNEVVPTDLTSPANILALLGVTPQVLLGAINANPLLLRMISDTMCTYSVLWKHASSS